MEEAYRAGGVLEKTPTKAIKDPSTLVLKREDIDLIVRIHLLVFTILFCRFDSDIYG